MVSSAIVDSAIAEKSFSECFVRFPLWFIRLMNSPGWSTDLVVPNELPLPVQKCTAVHHREPLKPTSCLAFSCSPVRLLVLNQPSVTCKIIRLYHNWRFTENDWLKQKYLTFRNYYSNRRIITMTVWLFCWWITNSDLLGTTKLVLWSMPLLNIRFSLCSSKLWSSKYSGKVCGLRLSWRDPAMPQCVKIRENISRC